MASARSINFIQGSPLYSTVQRTVYSGTERYSLLRVHVFKMIQLFQCTERYSKFVKCINCRALSMYTNVQLLGKYETVQFVQCIEN